MAELFIVLFFGGCLISTLFLFKLGARDATLETRFMRNKFRNIQENSDDGGISLSSISVLPDQPENQGDDEK